MDKQLMKYHHSQLKKQLNMQQEIEKDQQIDKLIQVQKTIKRYANGEKAPFETIWTEDNSSSPKPLGKITLGDRNENQDTPQVVSVCAKDIILQPFIYSIDDFDEHNVEQHSQEMSEEKRFKLHAFLSTPKFIKALTDISHLLSQTKAPKDIKLKMLKEEIKKINQQLPASVYIPFVNNSIRNFAVLHIPVDECKVFQTKERAPIMICVEMYRPEELSLYSDQQNSPKKNWFTSNNQASHPSNNSGTSMSFESQFVSNQNIENPYIQPTNTNNNRGQATKASGTKSKRSISQRKTNRFKSFLISHDPFSKFNKLQEDEEGKQIEKLADMRVSNALVIRKQKKRDSFVKRVLDDTYHDYGKGKGGKHNTLQPMNSMERKLQEESGEVYFDGLELNQIEMTKQVVPESHDRGSASKTFKESPEKKSNFENFYRGYVQSNERFQSEAQDLKNKFAPVPNTGINEGIQEMDEEGKNHDYSDSDEEALGVQEYHSSEEYSSLEDEEIKEPDSTGKVEDVNGYKEGDVKKSLNPRPKKKIRDGRTSSFYAHNMLIKENSKEQEKRMRMESPFGTLKSWGLFRLIVKSNDDVRQEQFAMQLLNEILQIFKLKKLPLWLKAYEILATGPNCGLIEVIKDAMSIDEIHRQTGQPLYNFYLENYGKGKKRSKGFKKAQSAFCYSLAAYSLACYILQIKDRHNQNIMLDAEGHICHIDFGFILSNAPGKGLKFEKAPFKLTQEFVDVLGGQDSKKFITFRNLMKMGFMALQEHADKIIVLVEMMMLGQKDLACFQEGENTVRTLKERFFPTGRRMNETEAAQFVDSLIKQSFGNWRTLVYDRIQYCCQGIV